jgi:hypothetical protein
LTLLFCLFPPLFFRQQNTSPSLALSLHKLLNAAGRKKNNNNNNRDLKTCTKTSGRPNLKPRLCVLKCDQKPKKLKNHCRKEGRLTRCAAATEPPPTFPHDFHKADKTAPLVLFFQQEAARKSRSTSEAFSNDVR